MPIYDFRLFMPLYAYTICNWPNHWVNGYINITIHALFEHDKNANYKAILDEVLNPGNSSKQTHSPQTLCHSANASNPVRLKLSLIRDAARALMTDVAQNTEKYRVDHLMHTYNVFRGVIISSRSFNVVSGRFDTNPHNEPLGYVCNLDRDRYKVVTEAVLAVHGTPALGSYLGYAHPYPLPNTPMPLVPVSPNLGKPWIYTVGSAPSSSAASASAVATPLSAAQIDSNIKKRRDDMLRHVFRN